MCNSTHCSSCVSEPAIVLTTEQLCSFPELACVSFADSMDDFNLLKPLTCWPPVSSEFSSLCISYSRIWNFIIPFLTSNTPVESNWTSIFLFPQKQISATPTFRILSRPFSNWEIKKRKASRSMIIIRHLKTKTMKGVKISKSLYAV